MILVNLHPVVLSYEVTTIEHFFSVIRMEIRVEIFTEIKFYMSPNSCIFKSCLGVCINYFYLNLPCPLQSIKKHCH